MRLALLILVLIGCCLSCKKETVQPGGTVEIYLFESFLTVAGKCQVDASASILMDTATIKNEDIEAYSKSDYQFTLTEYAIQKVIGFNDTTPFAVAVDKKVIYYGFYKPIISSSSCDNSITMDIDFLSSNKITLQLGYPGITDGVTIDDQRNNPALLAALQNQGKLK